MNRSAADLITRLLAQRAADAERIRGHDAAVRTALTTEERHE